MKNVLITGGSSGIGRELVKQFSGSGYNVWFTYRTGAERAQQLINELRSKHVRSFVFEQGNWQSHQDLLAALPGTVDILINNAALGSGTVVQYEPEDHLQDQALFNVNVVGVLWLVKALLPSMLKLDAGKIVLLSSVAGGISVFPGFRPADCMSKAAIAYYAKHLAAELNDTSVDVFAVCPGATETSMLEASTLRNYQGKAREEFLKSLPKGRLIQPEEIANLIFNLCQQENSMLHGSVIDASLGLGAKGPRS